MTSTGTSSRGLECQYPACPNAITSATSPNVNSGGHVREKAATRHSAIVPMMSHAVTISTMPVPWRSVS